MSQETFDAAKIAIQTILARKFTVGHIAAFAELDPSVISFVYKCENYEYNTGVDLVTTKIIDACKILATTNFSQSVSKQSLYEVVSTLLSASQKSPAHKTAYKPAIDFLLLLIKKD